MIALCLTNMPTVVDIQFGSFAYHVCHLSNLFFPPGWLLLLIVDENITQTNTMADAKDSESASNHVREETGEENSAEEESVNEKKDHVCENSSVINNQPNNENTSEEVPDVIDGSKSMSVASDNDHTEDESSFLKSSEMKKDDSGIIVETCPGKSDDSESTEADETSPSPSKSSLKPKEDRPSLSNESGVLDVDTSTSNSEDGAIASYDISKPHSDSESEKGEERGTSEWARNKLARKLDSSDDSSSSSDDSDDNHEKEDDHEEEMDVDLTLPADIWKPLYEVASRERGCNNRFDLSRLMRIRAGGSVNLASRLTKYCTLDQHDGCVNCLHFNTAGSLLASGSDDLRIIVWDWAHKKPFISFDSGHRSNVFQCKFMPYSGDTHIISCARDGHVRLAELSSTGTCKGTKKLAQHKGAAHKLALLEDSSHVFYSCGEDALVCEIDIRQDKPNKLCITKENDRKVPLYSIHAHPFKSHEYCVGGRDHFIRIYDKRMLNESEDNACLKKFCPHQLLNSEQVKANVTCAVYNWNGSELIGSYNDEDIYMFSNEHSDGANYIHRYHGHRNNATVKGVNFYGPKSEFITSGSDCGNIFLWERESEKIITYFKGDDGGVINVLEPHPHNPFLATSGLDHDVKIWQPIQHDPTKLDGLKQLMRKNRREREEERISEPDMIDGHMMWVLLQRLRRSARRQARDDGEEMTPSSDDSEIESDADSDGEGPPQCVPS